MVQKHNFKSWLWIACALLGPVVAWAQTNPVYTDDSTRARDTLGTLDRLISSDNLPQAVRMVQSVLDEQGERLVVITNDPQLFVSVRTRVNAELLTRSLLLAQYRLMIEPSAKAMLEKGLALQVFARYQLTDSGFAAGLILIQQHLGSARFDEAFSILLELDQHPSRRDDFARQAAQLARLVVRYLAEPEVLELANRFCADAGIELADATREAAPASLWPIGWGMLDGGVGDDAGDGEKVGEIEEGGGWGVVPRPLWSVRLPIEYGQMREGDARPIEQADQMLLRGDRIESTRQLLNVYPTVAGNTVYLNDGQWISAWDRLTLEPRWKTRPLTDNFPGIFDDLIGGRQTNFRRGAASRIEDTNTVTVAQGVVLGTTGIATENGRDGDPRLHALEASTGEVLWSIAPPLLDEQLAHASIRGPISVVDDTVVFCVIKFVRTRRLAGLYMVGVDLHTGAKRWVRLLASAGALPYNRRAWVSDSQVEHRGVVYRTDRLGVVAAVQVQTGRRLWVRLFDSPQQELGQGAMPWETLVPIVDGQRLVTLSSDRTQLIVLNRVTGTLLATIPVRDAPASYLVRVGSKLAVVSRDGVDLLELKDLAGRGVRTPLRDRGWHSAGRVIADDQNLLVPFRQGVLMIDTSNAKAPIEVLTLDNPGNGLLVQGQLLVADDEYLHSYLPWSIADQMLQQRMDKNPDDARLAITYAELAFRSDKPTRIAGAIDRALAALGSADTPLARDTRLRLFNSLLAMIEASVMEVATDLELIDRLVVRLNQASTTNEQRVAYLMELGRLRDLQGRLDEGLVAYQTVLEDSNLAGSRWVGLHSRVRAELKATQQIQDLLERHGAGLYSVIQEKASNLPAPTNATEAQQRARAYPFAVQTPRWWLDAATRHEAGLGQTDLQLAALSSGVRASQINVRLGVEVESDARGELVGQLVRLLEKLDRPAAAAQVLKQIKESAPKLVLMDHGKILDSGALEEGLLGTLATAHRLPRIGKRVSEKVQVLKGWSIMNPVSRRGSASAAEHVAMISMDQGMIALWADRVGQDVEAGTLGMIWSRQFPAESPPVLVQSDPRGAFFYWPTSDGGWIERINAIKGETRWRSEPFESLFEPNADLERRMIVQSRIGGLIDTPLERQVRLKDQLLAMDERTLVIVERTGRAVAYDLVTGSELWTSHTPVWQVYDIDLKAGVLAIAGVREEGENRGDVIEFDPVVFALDARSGTVVHAMAELEQTPRWVRVSNDGNLVVGLNAEIVSVDPLSSRTNWTIVDHVFESRGAWLFDGRLFVLTEDRELLLADVTTGRIDPDPLQTWGRLSSAMIIKAYDLQDRVAMSTDRGVLIYDREGKLAGADLLSRSGGVLAPVPTADSFVTIERVARVIDDDTPVYTLHILDGKTAMLESSRDLILHEMPRSMVVLDGKVLLTAGALTIVYDIPLEPSKEE